MASRSGYHLAEGRRHGTANAHRWSAEEKLVSLPAYQKPTEEERGKFLREKGLHEADLQRWKAEMLKGMKVEPFVGGKKHPQAKRIAALAETAALLVLTFYSRPLAP